MGEYSQKAEQLFKSGYNCAQAVMCAFEDYTKLDKQTSIKIASSLGAGMGALREVCGAVSGMFIVAGLVRGCDDPVDYKKKREHYKVIQSLADKFKMQNKSI